MTIGNLPNFLIIGTQRGGTTWLSSCLAEHPQIAMCGGETIKEINFFDNDENWLKGIEWYQEHFNDSRGGLAVGEATPEYMYFPKAIERIADVLPDAKLIMILRNPIARAYSAYSVFHTQYEGISLRKAIQDADSDLLQRGLYADQLQHVRKHFPESQILVLIFEEMYADNLGTLRKIFTFLNVNEEFVPTLVNKTVNSGIFPRVQTILTKLGLRSFIKFIKTSFLGDIIRSFHKGTSKKVVPSKEFAILEGYYREPNKKLSILLNRDLPWQ